MNLEVEKVISTTTGFKLKLCEWNRINIFTTVPMDDFQVILLFIWMNLGLFLEQELMSKVHIVHLPHMDYLVIILD